MKDYSEWSKDELVDRLRRIEAAAETRCTGSLEGSGGMLAEQAERLGAIVENAVEGIITIDDHGVIESINPAAEKIFQVRGEEVIGRNVKVLMPNPYCDQHDDYIARYLETGEAQVIGIGREVLGRRSDGTTFPMDLAVSEMFIEGRRCFAGFIRDKTEHERIDLRLKIKDATTRTLAESSTVEDAASGLLKTICETLGWVRGELWHRHGNGSGIRHVETWAVSDAMKSELALSEAGAHFRCGEGLPGRVWESGAAIWIPDVTTDSTFIRKEGAKRNGIHTALAFPIRLRSETLAAMVFFSQEVRPQDIELLEFLENLGSQIGQFIERKQMENNLARVNRALAEKNRELETVVYVASHDLRSPLVNIQGFSKELNQACDDLRQAVDAGEGETVSKELLKPSLEDDIPEALRYIQAGVDKIDSLLSGFLRFSRLGQAALQIEPLEMTTLLGNLAKTVEYQLKEAGVRLELAPVPDCLGDETQIKQVFSNLLDNALKYLDPSRQGVIRISGYEEEGRAVYCVEDNGVGISPAHQEKIFQIFHRLNPTGVSGEGLGLTMTQRMLERQHGKIWVESEPGVGSRFFVSLPKGEAVPS